MLNNVMSGGSPILVVDNRDSFVFNLVRYLRELGAPVVVREAETLDLETVAALRPAGILLSPGPRRPADAVLCKQIVLRFAGSVPILGVCLGHQVIAEAFGGVVHAGAEPVHGKNADILHDGAGVFSGLPNPFSATRYHSLVVEEASLPACLMVSARASDGVVMGIRHRAYAVEGVQFHPEAALSEQGHALLANFLGECGVAVAHVDRMCEREKAMGPAHVAPAACSVHVPDESSRELLRPVPGLRRTRMPLAGSISARQAFERVQSLAGTVFLDSAKRQAGTGDASMVAWSPWMSIAGGGAHSMAADRGGCQVKRYDALGLVRASHHASRDVLDEVRFQLRLDAHDGEASCDLPGGFLGGAIGMLGYEAWDPARWLPGGAVECETGWAADSADRPGHEGGNGNAANDAWFWFHRFVLHVDHLTDAAHLVATLPEDGCEAERLIGEAVALVSGAVDARTTSPEGSGVGQVWEKPGCDEEASPHAGVFVSNFDEPAYHRAIGRMRAYIRSGDIYIANMTRQIQTLTELSGPELHRRLRDRNPAAFSAYFPYSDRELVSASPERFLRIRKGWVETKPIKGTRPRGATPQEDEANRLELEHSGKDRAELLMITDLERNDLSRVCDPGTVDVTALFELETLPTVFHLVSTVRGRLSQGNDAIDCLRACFPGGSITGAPKLRAMEVIRELEGIPRGPYTGCLGWIGFNGDADFSILIRTFVKQGRAVRFGVGGGITWDSDPAAEWQETCDKARALVEALGGA